MRKILLITAAIIAMCSATSAFAGHHEGWVALQAGDYDTAMREFKANTSNVNNPLFGDSAFMLGAMYDKGEGVEIDKSWKRASRSQAGLLFSKP